MAHSNIPNYYNDLDHILQGSGNLTTLALLLLPSLPHLPQGTSAVKQKAFFTQLPECPAGRQTQTREVPAIVRVKLVMRFTDT
jgi:hypothetical protein